MAGYLSRGLADIVAASTALSDVDGARGRLSYRGYDIHDLASGATFEEVAYLLQRGSPPTPAELAAYRGELAQARALLHADHTMNASTSAARVCAATLPDMHSAIIAALGALKGRLHGGANEQVMRTLEVISKDAGGDAAVDAVEPEVRERLARGEKVMGFGHRVYKVEDPRATHLRQMSAELGRASGGDTLYRMSQRMEEVVFAAKGLYPNVDFYAASVYRYLGVPVDLFTPVFSVSRMAGWTAHVMEQHAGRLIRPDSEYAGERGLTWPPLAAR
ncbi:MAG: citrate/2-methylcitrate synthase [Micromonosporaceae bacterium]